jgi:hypothetical protein
VRTEPCFGVLTTNGRTSTAACQHANVVDVEEAILQLHVDIVADRLANAGNHLPGKARVAVVEECRLIGENPRIVEFNASNTDTAADKAAEPGFVIAEIEHAVDHEAQRRRVTDGLAGSRESHALTGQTNRLVQFVEISLLVSNFRLKAERTEIIADERFAVITIFGIDRDCIADRTDIDIDILNDHRTEAAADIPGAIARKCRGGEHGGCQRHSYGELPHNLPLFYRVPTGTTLNSIRDAGSTRKHVAPCICCRKASVPRPRLFQQQRSNRASSRWFQGERLRGQSIRPCV